MYRVVREVARIDHNSFDVGAFEDKLNRLEKDGFTSDGPAMALVMNEQGFGTPQLNIIKVMHKAPQIAVVEDDPDDIETDEIDEVADAIEKSITPVEDQKHEEVPEPEDEDNEEEDEDEEVLSEDPGSTAPPVTVKKTTQNKEAKKSQGLQKNT